MNRYIPLIILGVLLNACAQIALKQGMRMIGHFPFSIENLVPVFLKASMNLFILTGIICYVISVIVWMLVLSRVEVSFAYPLLSMGYIVTAFAGYLVFNENMNYIRWSGILIICIGVYLITKTG